MNKLNYLIYILVFILTWYITQSVVLNTVIKTFWKNTWNIVLIKKDNVNIVYKNIKTWKEIIKKTIVNNLWNIKNKWLFTIDYLKFWNKEFLVKKDNWDWLIWANFITVKNIDWHNYFYAHNWPSQNYFIWNYINSKIKIWDSISIWSISNWKEKKYILYNIVTIKEKNPWKVNFQNQNDILFFTCVDDWLKRKIFLFREVK